MVDPEGIARPLSREEERRLNSLDIRDWADGILSDPKLCRDVKDEPRIQQTASWYGPDGPDGNWAYRLTRTDIYQPSDEQQSQYTLSAYNKQTEHSRNFRLPPGHSMPLRCDSDWQISPEQDPYNAQAEMLTYLRLCPTDRLAMRTRHDVEVAFAAIVKAYYKPDRNQQDPQHITRDDIIQSRTNPFDVLGEIFDSQNNPGTA